MNNLDHIVIAATSLKQGVDYVRSTLGVEIPQGGVHQTMGTHNHVMQLGNDAYLEVIAINPDVTAPSHPRWFGLDSGRMRDAIQQQPKLVTWVMNTSEVHQLVKDAGFDLGTPTALSRVGRFWIRETIVYHFGESRPAFVGRGLPEMSCSALNPGP